MWPLIKAASLNTCSKSTRGLTTLTSQYPGGKPGQQVSAYYSAEH